MMTGFGGWPIDALLLGLFEKPEEAEDGNRNPKAKSSKKEGR